MMVEPQTNTKSIADFSHNDNVYAMNKTLSSTHTASANTFRQLETFTLSVCNACQSRKLQRRPDPVMA